MLQLCPLFRSSSRFSDLEALSRSFPVVLLFEPLRFHGPAVLRRCSPFRGCQMTQIHTVTLPYDVLEMTTKFMTDPVHILVKCERSKAPSNSSLLLERRTGSLTPCATFMTPSQLHKQLFSATQDAGCVVCSSVPVRQCVEKCPKRSICDYDRVSWQHIVSRPLDIGAPA